MGESPCSLSAGCHWMSRRIPALRRACRSSGARRECKEEGCVPIPPSGNCDCDRPGPCYVTRGYGADSFRGTSWKTVGTSLVGNGGGNKRGRNLSPSGPETFFQLADGFSLSRWVTASSAGRHTFCSERKPVGSMTLIKTPDRAEEGNRNQVS